MSEPKRNRRPFGYALVLAVAMFFVASESRVAEGKLNFQHSPETAAENGGPVKPSQEKNRINGTQFSSGEDSGTTIRVDASNTIGSFENIAGGITLGSDANARLRFLSEIKPKLIRLKFPLYRIPENYKDLEITGNGISGLIKDIEDAKMRGGEISIQIYGMPLWISTSQDERVITNGIPNYAKYPSSDYERWSELVSYFVLTIKEIGIDVDCWEIYGEPTAEALWYKAKMSRKEGGQLIRGCDPNDLGHTNEQTIENFFLMFRATAKAIIKADPEARIGGCGTLARWDSLHWTKLFLHYLRQNDIPLHFYSWHGYSIDQKLSELLETNIQIENVVGTFTRSVIERLYGNRLPEMTNNVDLIAPLLKYHIALLDADGKTLCSPYEFWSTQFRDILDKEGFTDTDLIISEYNVNWLHDNRHDSHYGAAFIVRALMDITDSSTQKQIFYSLSGPMPFCRNGYRGEFYPLTEDDSFTTIAKASYNAFVVYSMLGDDCADLIHVNDDLEKEGIYSKATRDQDSISLLTTYYVLAEEPDYNDSKAVDIAIDNIPFSQYHYEIYLIDYNHSNSFLESGPDLEMVDSGDGSGDFNYSVDLDIYGVLMVKIME
ncbi:MAG: hypothetical protein K8R46_03950 [Pirellulales bacterium]|nr:hypothetical protein [Pirellulales bacterium]